MAKGINSWLTVSLWLTSIGVVLMLVGYGRGLVWAARAIDVLAMGVGFLVVMAGIGA